MRMCRVWKYFEDVGVIGWSDSGNEDGNDKCIYDTKVGGVCYLNMCGVCNADVNGVLNVCGVCNTDMNGVSPSDDAGVGEVDAYHVTCVLARSGGSNGAKALQVVGYLYLLNV